MFPIRETNRSLVAGGALSECDFLAGSIGERQGEGRLLMDRCGDRTDVRVVAKDA